MSEILDPLIYPKQIGTKQDEIIDTKHNFVGVGLLHSPVLLLVVRKVIYDLDGQEVDRTEEEKVLSSVGHAVLHVLN